MTGTCSRMSFLHCLPIEKLHTVVGSISKLLIFRDLGQRRPDGRTAAYLKLQAAICIGEILKFAWCMSFLDIVGSLTPTSQLSPCWVHTLTISRNHERHWWRNLQPPLVKDGHSPQVLFHRRTLGGASSIRAESSEYLNRRHLTSSDLDTAVLKELSCISVPSRVWT